MSSHEDWLVLSIKASRDNPPTDVLCFQEQEGGSKDIPNSFAIILLSPYRKKVDNHFKTEKQRQRGAILLYVFVARTEQNLRPEHYTMAISPEIIQGLTKGSLSLPNKKHSEDPIVSIPHPWQVWTHKNSLCTHT